jgi:hypothetical protein
LGNHDGGGDEEDFAVPFVPQSKKNGSCRVVLLVDTGSGRIAISGDVDPFEVIDIADNKNIIVEDLEMHVPMTPSLLLSDQEGQDHSQTQVTDV